MQGGSPLGLVVRKTEPRQGHDDRAKGLGGAGVRSGGGVIEDKRARDPQIGGVGQALTAEGGVVVVDRLPSIAGGEDDAITRKPALRREHPAGAFGFVPRV